MEILYTCLEVGISSLYGALHPAKQIDLPGGIETGRIQGVGIPGSRVLAAVTPGRRARGVNGGEKAGLAYGALRPGLTDARYCLFEVEVILSGPTDKACKLRVSKFLPPLCKPRRVCLPVIQRVFQVGVPGRGDASLGRNVVRPYGCT